MGHYEDKGSWVVYYPDNQSELDAALALPGSWGWLNCYPVAPPSAAQDAQPENTTTK